jgi:hypothetical protein
VERNGVATINFHSDGTSSGGEIRLASAKGEKITLRIFWLTGALQLERPEP